MPKYHFTPTITYIGKAKPHPELSDIIDGLCHDEWELTRHQLRKTKGESLDDACARYVRRRFEQTAKQSGYELDTNPFRIDVGLIVEDVTEEAVAKGVGFGITLGRRPKR